MISTNIVLCLGALAAYTAAAPLTSPASCANVQLLSSTASSYGAVASFCQSYLGIRPVTLTAYTTPVVTRTFTLPVVATGVSILLTVVPTTTETTVTTSTSATPSASTTTATVTSTAYLDNSGNTIFFGKRDLVPTPISKRAISAGNSNTVPSFLANLNHTSLVNYCNCNNFNVASTYTRTMAARPTVVLNTKTLSRTILSRTTTTSIAISTQVDLRTITVLVAAPVVTLSAVSFIPSIDSCPPTYSAAFLCPEGTAQAIPSTDPSYDPNYLSCGVFSQVDSFAGFCLYWNDDGQPAGSILSYGTTGDPTKDLTRSAVYGNASTDDCPSWSDYTCSSGSTTLTAIPSPTIKRRSSAPQHVKQKMPAHIPGTRGSKYVHTGKH